MKTKLLQIMLIIVAGVIVSSAPAETFYVAPGGNDSGAGTIGDPWATLNGARLNVQPYLDGSGDITVYFRGGTYNFTSTVTFGPSDSGTSTQSVTYAAYSGETPVFTSLQQVTGWTTHSGSIMKANLPGGISRVRYLHDESENWLEYSSTDFFRPNIQAPCGAPECEHWEPGSQDNKSYTIYPTSFSMPDPSKASQYDLRTQMTAWHAQVMPITTIDTGSRRIDIGTPCHYPIYNGIDDLITECWILNSIAGIDTAGEWACIDGVVYLWPLSGTGDIYAPAIQEMIRVDAGGDGNTWTGTPLQYINFDGITFTGCDYRISLADDIMGQHDWCMVDVDEGHIKFRNAANCNVTNCTFTKTGSDGVRLDRYAQNITVDNCDFSYMGKNGVVLTGRGPKYGDVNKNNTVINCHFNSTCRTKWDCAAVHIDQSSSNLVKQCYFEDLPMSAIIVSGCRESNIWEMTAPGVVNRDFHSGELHPDVLADPSGSSAYFYDHSNIVEECTFRAVHIGRDELIPAVSQDAPGFTNGMIYTTGRKLGGTDTFRKNYFYDCDAGPSYSHTWVFLGDGHEDYLDIHKNMSYDMDQTNPFEPNPWMSNNCNLNKGCRATANVKLNCFGFDGIECGYCQNTDYAGNIDFDTGTPGGSSSYVNDYEEMWSLLCPGVLPGPSPLPGSSNLQTQLASKINSFGGTVPTCTQDQDPPTPDPMTWASVPAAISSSAISMTATTATDPSGVEYNFDETSGNPGGSDSGWQDSTSYTDTGLNAATQYCYEVTARDKSVNQNATAASTNQCATTDAPDTTPPTPDPMTWASVPSANDHESISMTATTATDPSGVQYYFDEITGGPGATDSGWQSSTSYTDSGLDPSTQYTYTVTARDVSPNYNETAPSTAESATTDAPPQWTVIISDDFEGGFGNWNDGGTDCSLYTEGTYAHQGSNAVLIVDNTAPPASTTYTGNLALSGYDEVKVDFWYYPLSMDNAAEDFWLDISTNGGFNWTPVEEWNKGDEFENGSFYPDSVIITGFTLTDQTQIRFRCDASGNKDYIYLDEIVVSASGGAPDTDPPTPDPMTWASVPNATGENSIDMVATTASDPSGVQYYFDETTGGPGGTDSGWQSSASYTDSGLTAATQYCYEVKARDQSVNLNETAASANQCATTDAPDTTPPTPDPMTWAAVPSAGSDSAVSMTATTATDPSGVEYYFMETSANPGGSDSEWQDSTSYTDTGLTGLTQYCYEVQARDKSANQNATAWSTNQCATTQATPDTTPPSPDPMTWSSVPAAGGTDNISMTATTATDPSGVEYFFDETSGNPGGSDSGWQDPASYTDTGLNDSTQYCYRVQARDKSVNQNTTAWSTTECATTDAIPDNDPPTPDPMTWSSVPAAASSSQIDMTATTASDPSGVEYSFDETSGNPGASDSGWQSSESYSDTGLDPDTQYCYQVKARDMSVNQNETAFSTNDCATTPSAPEWTQIIYDDFESGFGNWIDGGTDCLLYTDGTYAHQGNNAIDLQDNTDTSVTLSPDMALAAYDEIKVDFWYYPRSFDNSPEDFWLDLSTNGGDTWTAIEEWNVGDEFENGNFYPDSVIISGYTLTNQTALRFRCDASGDADDVYLDEILVSAKSAGPPDTDPPTPNPATWSSLPAAGGTDNISMTAATGSDPSGVQYEFDETSGNPGGTDSGWQASASYTDSGLSPSTTYTYRVRMRDQSPNQNAGNWSTSESATTDDPPPDTDPPTPNPATWASVPAAGGTDNISMTATTGSDPSGVEYEFDETSGNPGGSDSDWQTSSSYTDSGLTESTQYCYRVRMRDQSPNQNTGSWSTTECATTSGGGSWHMVNNTDGSISYSSGDWSNVSAPGAYMDDAHWCDTSGECSYTFNGTQIRYYTFRYDGSQSQTIYIDDQSQGSHSTPAGPPEESYLAYESGTLSSGSHTIRVVTGSGEAHVDAFEYFGP